MKSVTIAVATTDRVSVAEHLARSSAFLVFETQDGRIVSSAARERQADACGNHAGFVEMLAGCDAVICGGIGTGAADSLAASGIRPVVAAGRHSIEDALALYLAGNLPTTADRVCLCH